MKGTWSNVGLPLKVTSTEGLKSLILISSSSSPTSEAVPPGVDGSGLISTSSNSANSGVSSRSTTDTERVRDRDLEGVADDDGRLRLVGVVDGSIAGGGVGARNEYDFSYQSALASVVER
jgi:hypothetical protein